MSKEERPRGGTGPPPGAVSALLQELARAPAPAAALPPTFRPGETVGRFELVRELGRGGFGVVYEARDKELGRTVAFKAVRPGASSEVREERLLREAEAAARLSHPNIVMLHDVGRCDRGPYLVLEMLHGSTLAERLGQGPLAVPESLRIAVEVAKGVAHAHSNGVVHRDLTPGNVFLCADGQVKVLDFGMAHAFGQRKLDGGTRAFMAPEQASGAPEDERTDVFALGVILYRTLAGELPFPDARALGDTRPAPALVVPGAPAVGELVARMLEKDPVKRPRDASEVLSALATFQKELERAPPTGSAPVRTGPRPSRLSDLYEELKRRRVTRSLLGWAVIAFAVLQIYEPVMHGLHLPEWTLSLVVAGLAIGFPVTAVLAWMFDITAHGIRRARSFAPVSGGNSGAVAGRLEAWPSWRWLAGAGVVVVLAAVGGAWLSRHGSSAATHSGFVIAVAPLYGADAESMAEAKTLRALVERSLRDTLGAEKGLAIRAADDVKPPRTKEEARALGQAIGADLVIWGEALVLRGEVDIQPYITGVSEGTTDISAKALTSAAGGAGDLAARKTKAADIGHLAVEAATYYFLRQNQPERALALLDKVEAPDPHITSLKVQVLLWRLHHLEEAVAVARAGVARWPQDREIRIDLATALSMSGLVEEGLAEERKAVELDPAKEGFWWNIVADLRALGDLEGARKELEQRIGKAPRDGALHNALGTVLGEMGLPDEALVEYRRAVELDPESDSYRLTLGRALLNRGDREAAKKELRAGVTVFRDQVHTLLRLGEQLLLAGAEEDGLAAIRKAIATKPKDGDFGALYSAASSVLLATGHEQEGIAVVGHGMELDSRTPWHNLLAVHAWDQGRYSEARTELAAASKTEDVRGWVPRSGSLVELTGDEPTRAEAWARRYASGQPPDPLAVLLLGESLLREGRSDDAVAAFRAIARAKDEDYGRLFMFLGLASVGRGVEGRSGLESYLASAKNASWPLPVISFYLGRIDEAALLAAAAHRDPERDRGQHCEAYFYLGMARLWPLRSGAPVPGKGDEAAAQELFKKAVETKARGIDELDLAKLALALPASAEGKSIFSPAAAAPKP